MVALAIKTGNKVVMKNHLYQFHGEVYLQHEGGPIGLELTGAVARVFMLWWLDGRLLEKVRELTEKAKIRWQVHFYMRYVDDSNIMADIIEPGMRVMNNNIVKIENKIEEDKEIQDDVRTANLIKEIANSICNFIQVEVDCPSMHQNKLLPILDLEVEMVNNKAVQCI